MYRSLLVPIDGSPFAEHALPFALSIARRAAASIELVVVISNPGNPFLASTEFASELAKRWNKHLEQMVERIHRSHPGPVNYRVLESPAVAPALCAHASQAGVDLVVMTTHGRGTLGRLWFGSVANELIQNLPVPVLLVRPKDGVPEWNVEPSLQHMLVALDGSLAAERILESAATLGTLVKADYVLLRVIDDIPVGTPELDWVSLSSPASGLLDEIRAVQSRVWKEAQDYLDRVAWPLQSRGLSIQTRVSAADDPGAAILEALAEPTTDLLAIETRVFGGVERKVIHGTTKPILVLSPAAPRQCNP